MFFNTNNGHVNKSLSFGLNPKLAQLFNLPTDKLICWGYTFGLDARDYTISWEQALERRSPEYFYSLVE